MIHLKTRFLKDWVASQDLIEVLDRPREQANRAIEELPKSIIGETVIFRTDQNQMATGFSYKDENDNLYSIVDANPCVAYFHIALQYSVHTSEFKKNMLIKTKLQNSEDLTKQNLYTNVNAVQSFLACASICSVFLYNSLESFLNMSIERFKGILSKDGAEINKKDVLRYSSFGEKVKIFLPQIYETNFAVEMGHKYEQILELKKLRDDSIHIKMGELATSQTYQLLIVHALRFDFNKAIEFSKDFINYYQPNLIEICDCDGVPH